jgi:mercuric ion transport protein
MTSQARGARMAEDRSALVVWSGRIYVVLAWLLALSVTAQVFIAGLAVFVEPTYWKDHTNFVHLFELLPVFLLILAFTGKMPRTFKVLPLVAFLLISLQYATAQARFSDPKELAALHPVNALLIFWCSIAMAQRSHRLIFGNLPWM